MGESWEQAASDWAAYLNAGGMSPETVRMRCYHVRRVAREVGGTPESVTSDQLTTWLAGQHWRPNTRRATRASLRSFYRWAVDTGRVSRSPAHDLPPVKVPRAQPRPASEDAFRLALRAADDRARRAILLAGVCGLRRGEIARVTREDLEPDLAGWTLRVVGKGGHVRLVPLPDEVARELRQCPPGWVFPSSHGGHLTPHHLGRIVSRWLPDGLTTHTLRHRAGTVAYASARDLRAVQTMLGHAKPETTALYTAVPDDAVRAAVAACV